MHCFYSLLLPTPPAFTPCPFSLPSPLPFTSLPFPLALLLPAHNVTQGVATETQSGIQMCSLPRAHTRAGIHTHAHTHTLSHTSAYCEQPFARYVRPVASRGELRTPVFKGPTSNAENKCLSPLCPVAGEFSLPPPSLVPATALFLLPLLFPRAAACLAYSYSAREMHSL